MPQDHRLQPQRFELKYLIAEELSSLMRDFLSCYLELDEYVAGKPDFSYPVHSVYLDSDDLKTCHASVNGTRNRFKLRMRYYDDEPHTPVFFEVKTRYDNCIHKQRCAVRRSGVPLLLAGQLPEPEHLLSNEPRHLASLQHFNFLVHQLNARPKAHNHYLREAWVSPCDNSIRVTFDRNVRIEPWFGPQPVVEFKRPFRLFRELTVLELKFTTRFPNWFKEMVERFELMQFSSAKYAEGVIEAGEQRFVNQPGVSHEMAMVNEE